MDDTVPEVKESTPSSEVRDGYIHDVGFIITRCVKKPEHNILYQECYAAIRKFHPHLKIIFIDDNSDTNVLEEIQMTNVEIVKSDFPAAAEYLPYYYLLTRKYFKKAIIMQDSMIINQKIPHEYITDFSFFFEIVQGEMRPSLERLLSNTKKPSELLEFANNYKGIKCWGTCMVITYDFLQELEEQIGIMKWRDLVKNREMRIALEDAMGTACVYLRPNKSEYSMFGEFYRLPIIVEYGNENYRMEDFMHDLHRIREGTIEYSVVKVWNTR